MNEMNNYKYCAFISYKSTDEKWARWIQEQLQSYRLPSYICKRYPQIDKKLRPAFRYHTDILPRVLHEELEENLRYSKYLIIVCSTESAKSKWVGEEARIFIEQGKADKIITFIVNGSPYSGGASECYHPVLKETFPKSLSPLEDKQLLGINLNEKGNQNKHYLKSRAVVQIVARILDLTFDELWDRERKRILRRNIYYGVVSLFFVVLFAGLYSYYRTEYLYYSDYVIHRGIPEGIYPINKSDLDNYQHYYKFEFSQGRLERVVHCDWFGNPSEVPNTELKDRFAIQEFNYENGYCSSITYYNSFETPQFVGKFTNSDHTKMDLLDWYTGNALMMEGSTSRFDWNKQQDDYNIQTGWPKEKSNIGRFSFKYDNDGYLIEKKFNPIGRDILIADNEGIAGYQYQLDSLHRTIKIYYINIEEEKCSNTLGVASKQYVYSQSGKMYKTECYDIRDSLTIGEEGAAITEAILDEYGNLIEELYFDVNHKPRLNIFGFHRVTHEVTKEKNIMSYFDANNEKTLLWYPNLNKIHKQIAVYDKYGNNIEVSYYGKEDEPCYDGSGTHGGKIKFDKKRRPVRIEYFDIDGNPTYNMYGIMVIELSYDEDNNIIERRYLDDKNNKRNSIYGYSKESRIYEHNHLLEVRIYNSLDLLQPTSALDNAAGILFDRDDQGLIKTVTLIGPDGNPAYCASGFAHLKYSYNSDGFCEECRAFGPDKKTIAFKINTSVSKLTRSFDHNGYLLSSKGYSWGDSLVWNNEFKYLKNGLVQEISNKDKYGQLVNNEYGFAVIRKEYGQKNELRKEYYYDDDRSLTINDSLGVAILEYDYDDHQYISDIYAYDANHSRTVFYNTNAWRESSEYDNMGNVIEKTFYDINNLPCNNLAGFHKANYEWHQNKQIVKEEYTDKNGNYVINKQTGYSICKTLFDSNGRPVQICCFGIDKEPVNSVFGYHKQIMKYDVSGNQNFNAFYDSDDNLYFNRMLNYAKTKVLFDCNGNVSLQLFYDADDDIINKIYVSDDINDRVVIYRDENIDTYSEYSQLRGQDFWSDKHDERQDSIINIMDSLTIILDERVDEVDIELIK